MKLPNSYLENMCLLGRPGQCRYLGQEGDEYHCLQTDAILRRILDREVELVVGADAKERMPVAINCSGYPET